METVRSIITTVVIETNKRNIVREFSEVDEAQDFLAAYIASGLEGVGED